MATTAASNYTASGSAFRKPGLSTDQFEAGFLITGLNALDLHDHTSGLGLGVGRLQTGSTPDAAGEVQISGDSLVWWGATAAATRTAVALEGTQTISGVKTILGSDRPMLRIEGNTISGGGLVAVLEISGDLATGGLNNGGGAVDFLLDSTTTPRLLAARIGAMWSDGVHATRTSYFVIQTVNSAGTIDQRVRITGPGVLKIVGNAATAERATTEGTNHLDIFDGTAPVGTLANGISLYSTAGELRVMDSGGVATLLSPHDRATGEWVFDSIDTRTGKRLRIDMERMARFLNQHFGTDWVQEFTEEPQ